MDRPHEDSSPRTLHWNFATTAGAALIVFGVMILADQYFHSGWLAYAVPLAAGLVLLARGIAVRSFGFFTAGGITSSVGAGILVSLNLNWQDQLTRHITLILTAFAVGLVVTSWLAIFLFKRVPAWMLVSAAVCGTVAGWFWLTPVRPLDYILFIPTGIGLALLLCGLMYRLFGLIIPGCILVSIGPGVYYAWGTAGEPNGLAQTGTMLVIFALGWGLITIFSRMLSTQFVWWPLIPGGVLAFVGWGLYIGGDPHNALRFIGNTGSIGLIIFGIYLLMWRNEIRRK